VAPAASLRAACIGYFATADFKQLDQRTQRIRRSIFEGICRERGERSGQEYGTCPIGVMKARHVLDIRDARADKPEAANARVKALRQVFAFALKDAETFKLETNRRQRVDRGGALFERW
jgi:hypothetical protein